MKYRGRKISFRSTFRGLTEDAMGWSDTARNEMFQGRCRNATAAVKIAQENLRRAQRTAPSTNQAYGILQKLSREITVTKRGVVKACRRR